ncbi:ABC-2 type transport system permease protein [Amycolatopsis arida]|uniref:Transport permease protein n=1 Tax=Amycolatopsis arida TaxID=587909 RepID=A0A1I5Z2G3_9PSEU|nr:ABC transporter permease [Amycolatopsis arida]TDX90066.1 ABC-2 type transport system permease protein [Amycolatopsis arida]SFQ50629.1 ABC-2 type transport system permease protein [Amycolatopsis arida]
MTTTSNPVNAAVRAGLQRGWIEFRTIATSAADLLGWLWMPIVALVVMYTLRGTTVPGTTFSLGAQAVPGILAMTVVFTGMMGLAMALTSEREDGTLLRAKATPHGVLGYLTGKVVGQATLTVAALLVVLVPSAFLFDGLRLGAVGAWLTLVWVLALGLVATLPIGAVLGSLAPRPQSLGFVMLLITGLVMASGVFYPVTAFPAWLQWIAQVFPLYWLGLGMRSALLPDALAVAEIGESWRHLETAAVLGAWAVLGFVVAPMVLGRMARRATGSTVREPAT